MNIKSYIDSGVIASYVLGLASEAEQQEFEGLCKLYPELAEAKRLFEAELEERLIKEAVPVPAGLKEDILRSLDNSFGANIEKPNGQRAYNTPVRKMNAWKLVAAACILLLVASLYTTYFYQQKYLAIQHKHVNDQRLQDPIYTNPLMAIDTIVTKSSVKWSALIEPKKPSHCMGHVYWDTISSNTFLLVGNIPPPVADEQFQLWALQGEKAINLGMFNINHKGKLVQMKSVPEANTFVITMEQKGGSLAPSKDAIYAMGKM